MRGKNMKFKCAKSVYHTSVVSGVNRGYLTYMCINLMFISVIKVL